MNFYRDERFYEQEHPVYQSIKAAAVVGGTGLLQIALSETAQFSGRDFIPFKTREEALDWLV